MRFAAIHSFRFCDSSQSPIFTLKDACIMAFLGLHDLSRRLLNTLAETSERLSRGAWEVPLLVIGPKEMRDLIDAFNTMQDRLTRFGSDRTQMLAALAHDLRSPLTALRVRAEMVDDDETRASLVTSTEEMQQMVEATLDYAKGVGQH